jgi:fructose-specific phosphotransferase system IIA component
MKITDILKLDSISLDINTQNKVDLLAQLLDLADKSGKITDKDKTLKEIFEREKILSTGIGKGIALPHAKTNTVSDTIGALAVMKKSIDYDSLDGEPVNIVFLLLGLEHNVGNHLKMLSKISRLLNNDTFREMLFKCKNNAEILSKFSEMEEIYES